MYNLVALRSLLLGRFSPGICQARLTLGGSILLVVVKLLSIYGEYHDSIFITLLPSHYVAVFLAGAYLLSFGQLPYVGTLETMLIECTALHCTVHVDLICARLIPFTAFFVCLFVESFLYFFFNLDKDILCHTAQNIYMTCTLGSGWMAVPVLLRL